MPDHLSVPEGAGPWPGVVVVHEALGLTDDIRAKADRFAGRGYVALAPDLFADGPMLKCLLAAFRALMRGSGPQFEVLDRARETLAAREDCTGSVGIIGFCMGGGFALLAAPKLAFAASAVNYGQVPKDAEQVLRGSCPIVASYGKKDLTLRNAAAKLERALDGAGVEHDIKEYPTTGHSFMSAYDGITAKLARVGGFTYDETAARDAWQRIDTFFDRHVAGKAA
jgi:carboxymethylenebutenolidase